MRQAALRRRRVVRRALLGLLAAAWLPHLPASADEWSVDQAASTVAFEGRENGVLFQGRFERFVADIRFDPDALDASHVTVVVDTASFNSGVAERDEIATGVYWFEVDVFPDARFEAHDFTHIGDNLYEATADLTIRDQTVPVVFPFELAIDGDTAHVRGEVVLNRRQFRLGRGDGDIELVVGLSVPVTVELTATRSN